MLFVFSLNRCLAVLYLHAVSVTSCCWLAEGEQGYDAMHVARLGTSTLPWAAK